MDSNNPEQTVAQDAHIFDFFRLPRELRNEVYSLLTKSKTFCDGRNNVGVVDQLHVSIKAAPIPELFSLCRQFKAEYQETFKHGMTITIKDLYTSLQAPTMAAWPDDISRVQIVLLLICKDPEYHSNESVTCGIAGNLHAHLRWIEEMLPQLKQLKDLEIRIYPCQGPAKTHKPIDTAAVALTQMVALPVTSLVEVYPFFELEE